MKYLKYILFYIILISMFSLITTIISYFDIINENTLLIIKRIIIGIINIITGLYIGKNSKEKGYLEGIKFGLIIIITMVIFTIIMPMLEISIKSIIYYLVIGALMTIGSTIGINLKRQNN